MTEKIIDGIKYRLNEETKTAEVIHMDGYKGDIIIPETVVHESVSYRVTSIGEGAFYQCESLKSIIIPDTVTSIGDGAFCDCESLTNITIPDCVTSIGDCALKECSSLTTITIPNGITSIGEGTFSYCKSLKSITIPNGITSIGEGIFCSCESLTNIVVARGNTIYDSREECNAIIETGTNTLICGCQTSIIPNSVTSIGEGAFFHCESLTDITIPNSVKSIEDGAFCQCSSLTSITIPNSVTSIGYAAFWDCSSLTSITFQGTIAQWKEIALDENWNNSIPTKFVHCTDGDIGIQLCSYSIF